MSDICPVCHEQLKGLRDHPDGRDATFFLVQGVEILSCLVAQSIMALPLESPEYGFITTNVYELIEAINEELQV